LTTFGATKAQKRSKLACVTQASFEISGIEKSVCEIVNLEQQQSKLSSLFALPNPFTH
jgi:hypothetical protein